MSIKQDKAALSLLLEFANKILDSYNGGVITKTTRMNSLPSYLGKEGLAVKNGLNLGSSNYWDEVVSVTGIIPAVPWANKVKSFYGPYLKKLKNKNSESFPVWIWAAAAAAAYVLLK